jgi:outer membrane protein OmpA-like peptidoglycan-associated protein/tetratricopeptide (TPR) repeat protein
MKKSSILILLLCFIGLVFSPAKAQVSKSNVKNKQAEKIAKKGDKFFKNENYYQALEHYNKALQVDSSNVRALANGGICNLKLYSNLLSVRYLQKAFALNPTFDIDLRYWLGRAYHLTQQPDQAITEYLEYNKLIPFTDPHRDEIARLLTQARFLKVYMSNPSDNVVLNQGSNLNSQYPDYSPVLTSDGKSLIFTSRRINDVKSKIIQGEGFETIYTSNQFFDGSWSKPELVSRANANKKQHVSGVQLFDNDKKLLIYNSSKFGSLLTSERNGSGWSEPVALNKYTNTNEYEASGFVNDKDSSVYFASSKGSKDGNLDLFVSRKEANGKWGEPLALSNIINTDQDEDGPFITKDGMTLYFSSRGHDGMGGYDVFKCRYNPSNRSWSRPINLGYPINSPSDDIYFISNDSTGIGYVSSNRMGTLGGTDIYRVKPLEPVIINGYITDKNTQKPLPGYVVQFTSLRSKEVSPAITSSRSDGLYDIRVRSKNQYRLDVSYKGEVIYTEEFKVPMVDRENVKIIHDLQVEAPAIPPSTEVQKITVANVNLLRITYQEFDTLIINGAVKDSGQAIASAQVQLREESVPTALYTTTTDSKGNYRFAFVPGKKADYVVEITQPGYQFASVVVLYVLPNPKSKAASVFNKDVNVVDLSTSLMPLRVGSKSVLGGIYFEFNSAVLKPSSSIVLDRLYNVLNDNPTIRMEIAGHADNLGTSFINRVVSQKRAQSVLAYLVSKGIEKGRLVSKGYGEDEPIAPNGAEFNGRDVNRRIEIKILAK